VDTQYGYEHYPCLQHLLESIHSQNYIFEPISLDILFERPLFIRDNDTWSPILCGLSNDSQNGNLFADVPSYKSMKFIETKVPAMKLQGFNQCLV
jgi:hypothetical protein